MKSAHERAVEFCERGEGKAAEFPGYVERLEAMLNEHAAQVLREVNTSVRREAENYDDDDADTIVIAVGVALDDVAERAAIGSHK